MYKVVTTQDFRSAGKMKQNCLKSDWLCQRNGPGRMLDTGTASQRRKVKYFQNPR